MFGKKRSSKASSQLRPLRPILTVMLACVALASAGTGWALAQSAGWLGNSKRPAARTARKAPHARSARIGISERLALRSWRKSPRLPADTTPPQTTLTSQPAAATTEPSASFSFTASESGSSFACKLDAGSWGSCSSPKSYSALAVGRSAERRVGNEGGGKGAATPDVGTWTVEAPAPPADPTPAEEEPAPPADITPPETTLTSKPTAATTETSASFSFTASESGSSFACKLDAGSWGSCSSPKSYSALAVGRSAERRVGNEGGGKGAATPDVGTWTVEAPAPPADPTPAEEEPAPPADITPPETTLTSKPAAATTETSASFSFTASESGSSFACKLDAGSWGSCSSPKSYSALAVGAHTFSVRASDAAGNVDATPAVGTWTVEAPASPGAHCFSSPHTCGYPDETNTGASGSLTSSGSITVSTNGSTIKDKEVSGKITINASNVTIENVKIVQTASGSDTQAISNNGSGNVIKNVTAGGKGTGSNTIEAAVRGFSGVTLERDYFYNCNECVQGGATVKDSYIVVSSIYSGAHAEDIYICSDTVNVNHSTLINTVNQTATVFGDTICGGGNKYTVTNSLLAGSGYVFYPQANNTNPSGAQTTITGNRVARCLGAAETREGGHWLCNGGSDSSGIYPFGGSYGIGAYFSGPTTWSGNVWDDNLATIPEPEARPWIAARYRGGRAPRGRGRRGAPRFGGVRRR